MKLNKRQKTILKTVWLFCPECGKSWRGLNFQKLYEAQIREVHKDITDDELQRRVKASMKAQKMTGNQSALIEDEQGVFHCPYCGQLYTYDTICKQLRKKRIVIAISKFIVFIIKLFKR